MAWGGRGGAIALALAVTGVACGRLGYDPAEAADAAPPDAPDAAPPRAICEQLPHLAEAPAIDGVIETALVASSFEVGGWKGPPDGPPAGNVASVAAGWWSGGLYIWVAVTDPERLPPPTPNPTWCGDGVELYADHDGSVIAPPGYDEIGTRQLVMVAPADDATPVTRGELFRQTALIGDWLGKFESYPREGGYVAEAIITAADLGLEAWPLEAGQRVGFDLAVNVSNTDATTEEPNCPTGTRLGQYFLRVDPADATACAGHPYCDAAAFCTPVLGE